MKLDKTFSKEVQRTANGDGSREAKFRFLKAAREAAKEMSTTKIRYTFGEAVKKHGRAVVGICVAVSILEREDRLERKTVWWATEVLNLWTNRPPNINVVNIVDGLHPTRIEEYAGSFIRLTTEET